VADLGPGNPLFGDLRGTQAVRVAPGSPAAKFGLQPGDVIVGIDETDIKNSEHLFRYSGRTG